MSHTRDKIRLQVFCYFGWKALGPPLYSGGRNGSSPPREAADTKMQGPCYWVSICFFASLSPLAPPRILTWIFWLWRSAQRDGTIKDPILDIYNIIICFRVKKIPSTKTEENKCPTFPRLLPSAMEADRRRTLVNDGYDAVRCALRTCHDDRWRRCFTPMHKHREK